MSDSDGSNRDASVKNHQQAIASFLEGKVDLDELAAQQGVEPITNLGELFGDFWPEDETADEFLAELERWRREGEQIE